MVLAILASSVTVAAPPRPPSHDELEALIEEARRRARRRRWAYGLFLLLAGVAVGLYFGIGHGGNGGSGRHANGGPAPAAETPAQEAQRIIRVGERTVIGEAVLVAPDLGWAMNGLGLWWTRDGGSDWRVMTPPEVASSGDVVARVVDIAAVDDTHVWISAADVQGTKIVNGSTRHMVIERTRDGGKTWQASIPPGCYGCGGAHVSFVDTQNGFALAAASQNRQFLFATHDGGATWRRVGGNVPWSGPIRFVNARAGWAVSDPRRMVGPSQSVPLGGGVVYGTRDGGRHWRPVALAVPPRYGGEPATAGMPHFFGSRVGVAPVRFVGRKHAQHLVVYVTHDGGNSWSPRPAPLDADLRAQSWGFPEALPFSAATADSWFLFVGRRLYWTRDAGRTWSVTRTVAPKAPRVWDVSFTSPLDGWAIFAPVETGPHAGSALVKTTDGGRHWTPLAPQARRR
jgi:photosystem II stability/assembly factor-like uncharacterized protein